jgi:hypothetical protein
MVDQMKTYLQAGVFAVLVLLIGIMIGIWLDNYRIDSIRNSISESDINWNDVRLLDSYFKNLGTGYCNLSLEQNLAFNDKIYSEGKEIEKRIESNSFIFTSDLEQEWRRYNLLQVQFWLNSIDLKNQCKFGYHNVIHLSRIEDKKSGSPDDKTQSLVMLELKDKCGNKIMLIPLTADVNLIVIDSIIRQFNITKFPAVIIDEKTVFQGLTSLDTLQKVVNC